MACEKGHVGALFNLALYYNDVGKNYKNAVKYYLMALEKGYVKKMSLNYIKF